MDQTQTVTIELYQKRVEEEYIEKFKQYVGADPYSENTYSEPTFKEIMARTITFWQKLYEDIEETSPELEYRKQFAHSMFEESVKYVNETLTPEQIEFVANRSEQLYDKKRSESIEKCRKKLLIITQVSNDLFQRFSESLTSQDQLTNRCVIMLFEKIIGSNVQNIKTTKIESTILDLFEPTVWLSNQDLMKTFTEEYQSYVETLDNSEEFFDNIMFKYFKFMHKSYPSNYNNVLMDFYSKYEQCDGAELYYEMTK